MLLLPPTCPMSCHDNVFILHSINFHQLLVSLSTYIFIPERCVGLKGTLWFTDSQIMKKELHVCLRYPPVLATFSSVVDLKNQNKLNSSK